MKKMSLAEYLESISISRMGRSWKDVISAGFNTVEKILAMSVEQLANVGRDTGRTVGERALEIHQSLHSPRVLGLLQHADKWVEAPQAQDTSALKIDVKGKNVCFTGTGPCDRKKLTLILEAAGAKVCSSVTKNTHILLIEDANSTSTKAQSARALGTKIISYSDALSL